MDKRDILKYAFINSFSTAFYIVAVVLFISTLGRMNPGDDSNIFIPIAMLMLFVFSAALTGALVFGRPIMWYFDGRKSEAVILLFSTLVIFALLMIVAFLFIILS